MKNIDSIPSVLILQLVLPKDPRDVERFRELLLRMGYALEVDADPKLGDPTMTATISVAVEQSPGSRLTQTHDLVLTLDSVIAQLFHRFGTLTPHLVMVMATIPSSIRFPRYDFSLRPELVHNSPTVARYVRDKLVHVVVRPRAKKDYKDSQDAFVRFLRNTLHWLVAYRTFERMYEQAGASDAVRRLAKKGQKECILALS